MTEGNKLPISLSLCIFMLPQKAIFPCIVYYQGPLRFYFSMNINSSITYILHKMRKIPQGCYEAPSSWKSCLALFRIITHPLFTY